MRRPVRSWPTPTLGSSARWTVWPGRVGQKAIECKFYLLAPLRAKNKLSSNLGLFFSKRRAWQNGFNAANDTLIRDIQQNERKIAQPNQTNKYEHVMWYLSPTNSDQCIFCCVETVLPSRSFWVQRTQILRQVGASKFLLVLSVIKDTTKRNITLVSSYLYIC